jgi:hypothetical protein
MNSYNVSGLRIRETERPLKLSHLRQPTLCTAFMGEIESEWRRYMREHDSPEQWQRDKNPIPFRL